MEPKRPVVKRAKRSKPDSIKEHIEALQKLGFSISMPTIEQDNERQAHSKEKLGFKNAKKPDTKPELIKGYLHTTHYIAGGTYGPGEVTLDDPALLRTLLQQDQACIKAHRDTSDYEPISRCFMITPGKTNDRYHRFSKKEVSADYFSSEAFILTHSIVAGKQDVPGESF